MMQMITDSIMSGMPPGKITEVHHRHVGGINRLEDIQHRENADQLLIGIRNGQAFDALPLFIPPGRPQNIDSLFDVWSGLRNS